MVWYSDDAVSPGMALQHTLTALERGTGSGAALFASDGGDGGGGDSDLGSGGDGGGDSDASDARKLFVQELRPLFLGAGFAEASSEHLIHGKGGEEDEESGEGDLQWALGGGDATHVMEATRARLLCSLLTVLRRGWRLVHDYNERHPDAPMVGAHLRAFAQGWCVHAVVWGVAAQMLQHPQLLSLVGASGGLPGGGRGVTRRAERLCDGAGVGQER